MLIIEGYYDQKSEVSPCLYKENNKALSCYRTDFRLWHKFKNVLFFCFFPHIISLAFSVYMLVQ
jgi:hypothetical protein